MQAYSRLKVLLDEQGLTVPELHRRIQRAGLKVNVKSLYRLSDERQSLERLDLRVAGMICHVCSVPLSALIAFEMPGRGLRRLSAAKQRRLNALMTENNVGRLSAAERAELETLVREAEAVTLANARLLAGQRKQLATS